MRTFSRQTFEEAQAAWAEGEFGSEWEPYRRAAAQAGFLFPPNGTRWDQWDDAEPSQRAVIAEAMANTPQALRAAIQRATSWSGVVARMTQHRARLREAADLTERDAAWARRDEPTREEATASLRGILGHRAGQIAGASAPPPEVTPPARAPSPQPPDEPAPEALP